MDQELGPSTWTLVLSVLGTARPIILRGIDLLLVLWCVCVGDVSLEQTAHLPLCPMGSPRQDPGV